MNTCPARSYCQAPSPPTRGASGAVEGARTEAATSPLEDSEALAGIGSSRATSRDRGEALTVAVVLPEAAGCSGMMAPPLHQAEERTGGG